jgi:tetratricopeptide (TPR) repeat protein
MPSSAPEDWTEKLFARLHEHEGQRESLGYGRQDDALGLDASRALGELARDWKLLSPEQLEEFLREAKESLARGEERSPGQFLRRRGWLKEEDLGRLLEELTRRSDGIPDIPRYEILDRLGEGTTAVVYRARDRELNRPVALKLLRASSGMSELARQRFRRESQAAAAVAHPNVMMVYDAGDAFGRLYLAMELVDGTTLDRALASGGRGLNEKLRLFEKAVRGVAAAHQKGIVHRDLKPTNILVSSSGEPKVGDFGLAHLVDSTTALTRTGATLGTPLYMSPEQVEGRIKDISPRTDVYSLGAILYQVITGKLPHEGQTIVELYGKILGGDLVLPRSIHPELSRDLETIVLKALEKNPQRRYADAGELADDLARHLAGQAVLARPVSPVWRAARKVARHRTLLLAAIPTFVVLAAAVLWFARSRTLLERYHAAYQAGTELWTRAVAAVRVDRAAAAELALGSSAQLQRAAELLPDRPEPWLMIGRCRLLRGEGRAAEEAWEEALRRDPRFGPALFERGLYYAGTYARMRTPAPARTGSGGIRFGTAEPETATGRGWRVKGEAALKEASQASGLGDAERRYLEGLLNYGKGGYRDAVAALGPYASANPWDARALAVLGNACYYAGEFGQAEIHLSQALRVDSRLELYRARAYARYSLGHYAEALEDTDACLRSAPNDPELLCDRGLILQALGRLEEAEKEYTRAIGLRPDFERALNGRGTVFAERRLPEPAREDFERVIFGNPLHPEAYNNLGNVLVADGKFDRAIEEFSTALSLDSGNPETYANRALAWRLKGELRKSLADLEQASQRDPRNPEFHWRFAVALDEQEQRAEAIKQLRLALDVAPKEWPRRSAAEDQLQRWSK